MKKVFLSLAVIAALTVVSCKQAENNAEETAADTTAVVEEAAPVVDTTATAADTTATEAAAPAEAPAGH